MEEYRIVLESQLGLREGTLRWNEENQGTVTGTITLLGVENAASGEWIGEHSLRLSHHLRTRVSDLECVSVFDLKDGKLSGTLRNEKNTMFWHGEKLISGKGGEEENAGK